MCGTPTAQLPPSSPPAATEPANAADAATTIGLEHWRALTQGRRWSGRMQRLASLLDNAGLVDLLGLKEAFLTPNLKQQEGSERELDAACNLCSLGNRCHQSWSGRALRDQVPELCGIVMQLSTDERKHRNLVLEAAKRRLLTVLAELEPPPELELFTAGGSPPVASPSSNSATVPYSEHRRQQYKALAEAKKLGGTEINILCVRCLHAAVGTIVGKGGANLKSIGAKYGIKVIWSQSLQCFEIKGSNVAARERGKSALVSLELKFKIDQISWSAEKARRRAERAEQAKWLEQAVKQAEHYEIEMGPERWKEEASSLWQRHRRGKRKASAQHRQQDTIDRTRRSTGPGGRRSKPLKFADDSTGTQAMRRMLRSAWRKDKQSARGANSSVNMQLQAECADEDSILAEAAFRAERAAESYQQYGQQLRAQRKQAKQQAKERARVAKAKKKVDPVLAAVLCGQPTGAITLDTAAKQQWDMLAQSRRWGGLLQQLINLLRPQFAGVASFALKQAFALCCDTNDITAATATAAGTVVPQQGTPVTTELLARYRRCSLACGDQQVGAVMVQLLAPCKPKRQSSTAAGAVVEQAARLRLGRAVELLLGDALALTQAQATYAQKQSTRPEPEQQPEPLEPESQPQPQPEPQPQLQPEPEPEPEPQEPQSEPEPQPEEKLKLTWLEAEATTVTIKDELVTLERSEWPALPSAVAPAA
jgi:hypothetical protein